MKKTCMIFLIALLLAMSSGCSIKPVADDTKSVTHAEDNMPSASSNAAAVEPTDAPIQNNTSKPVNEFMLSVTLLDSKHKLKVSQSLTYCNNTGVELSEIYFNLIPQAFRGDGGGTTMAEVTVSSKRCALKKVKETVYKLSLPSTLADGDKLQIQMEYEVSIPNIKNRFGYQKKVFNLGNFIATPAVYGKDGWSIQSYVDIGDAFYTDIANYTVDIKVPKGYTVAATGTDFGGGRYTANNVRDFAFCTSNSYEMLNEKHDGVSLNVYYADNMSSTAQRVIDIAKKSLDLYNGLFGRYPYETLRFIINGLTGGVSGMEYPTLIMLSPDLSFEQLSELGVDLTDDEEMVQYIDPFDRTICHEIAHQWFYGIVGNNQISEPWLDEGFCRFAEYLYQQEYSLNKVYENVYLIKDRMQDIYMSISGDDKNEGVNRVPDKTYLNKSLYYWKENDPMGYGEIYDKGASLIYMMQQQMGEESFYDALKEYIAKFSYSFVTTNSFKKFWNNKADFKELYKLYF